MMLALRETLRFSQSELWHKDPFPGWVLLAMGLLAGSQSLRNFDGQVGVAHAFIGSLVLLDDDGEVFREVALGVEA